MCGCLCDASEQDPSVSMCLCECVSLGGGRAQCVPGVAVAPAHLDCGVALAQAGSPRGCGLEGTCPPAPCTQGY